eukprot:5252976-Prymnesium_polylepis.1
MLSVQGGELRLIDCQVEDLAASLGSAADVGRRSLSASSAGERALLIRGGRIVLEQTVLRGHPAGAIDVSTASLELIACTISESSAESGAAILVASGAEVRIVSSNLTDNHAIISGGALQ